MTIIDADLAKRLLTSALGGTPELSEGQIADLMQLASDDDGGTVVYPASGLQRAASLGWQWKAGLVADKYDLGGGQGKTLDESQWFDHCMRMAGAYASGAMHVIGTTTNRKGISSIGLTTELAT